MHEVTKKFRETVKQWDLWKRGEPLGLAVSGGIDSMVLLDLVRRIKTSERSHATVFHFNHKLRGEESDQDALFVKKICEGWKIPLVVGEAPPWKKKNNLQEKARQLRYQFFREEAKKAGIQKIATAHQADDQAETFLIRWIQGAGLKGLSGIPLMRLVGQHQRVTRAGVPTRAQRVSTGGLEPEAGPVDVGLTIVRPLLFVTRKEITDYAKKFEVPFREDSSNRETKYLRNKVRQILSELRKLNPNLSVRSAVNSILLRADEEYLETVGSNIDSFNIPIFTKLPPSLRYRLLQRMYEEVSGHPLSGEFVLKIDSLIRDSEPKRQYNLPHGVRFQKDYVCFRFAET
ncbi:MAG: tRNA lysidine(34) synthetase TilS [Deltaproteobacteria bacterium]|nr:tRNA lysidine(34) synthetase TilS [Deltaproteobacteria bacterium]